VGWVTTEADPYELYSCVRLRRNVTSPYCDGCGWKSEAHSEDAFDVIGRAIAQTDPSIEAERREQIAAAIVHALMLPTVQR
jgi:hypothetical protein